MVVLSEKNEERNREECSKKCIIEGHPALQETEKGESKEGAEIFPLRFCKVENAKRHLNLEHQESILLVMKSMHVIGIQGGEYEHETKDQTSFPSSDKFKESSEKEDTGKD